MYREHHFRAPQIYRSRATISIVYNILRAYIVLIGKNKEKILQS